MTFRLTILGSNSAIPAHGRFPSASVLNIREQLYLIDCGEGTQMRMNDFKIKRSRIHQIFISHLHGDHIFGLAGLITSFSLMGRKEPLTIYAPAGLREIIEVQFFHTQTTPVYELNFVEIDTGIHKKIFEDERVKVYSIPLEHRIPTCGFLFREQPDEPNFLIEKIAQYQIPVSKINEIKKGADFITADGKLIPNTELVKSAPSPRSFAYCSDTIYSEKIIPWIKGVDMLYHETTFLDNMSDYALLTKHTTARQAGIIARKAAAGMLITGHYSTRYENLDPILAEAREEFPNTFLGLDGERFDVPRKEH